MTEEAVDAVKMQKLLRDLGACSDAREWAKGKSLAEIWAQCGRADWLLWLIGRMEGKKGWPDRKAIVLVACDCAELALPYVKAGEDRPRIAIETARAWVRGEASIEEVRKAREAAYAAYAAYATAYATAYAAYAAANAYDAAAYDAAYAAADAAYAASDAYAAADAAAAYAADAAAAAAYARNRIREQCLAIIREKLTPDCLKVTA